LVVLTTFWHQELCVARILHRENSRRRERLVVLSDHVLNSFVLGLPRTVRQHDSIISIFKNSSLHPLLQDL
jgi:hypothetical protein